MYYCQLNKFVWSSDSMHITKFEEDADSKTIKRLYLRAICGPWANSWSHLEGKQQYHVVGGGLHSL